jgi:two-component system sensor histidine kinase PilS (NtrC family)
LIEPAAALPVDLQQRAMKSVKGVMLCRVVILTLLLTISFVFQISEKRSFFIPLTNSFYYFIGFFYLVTILYDVLLRSVQDFRRFTFVQMVLDHFFIIGLVFFTGGKDSFFPMTYVFSIIGSSVIFFKRGAFFSASLATLLYGLLLLLQYYRVIHPIGQTSGVFEPGQFFYSLVLYMAAFYIVAFLSSVISEELKRKRSELIQKQDDYDQLETFNRNIIQSLDSGLLTIDPEGKINFLNRTAEKILNVNGEGLRNVSAYDLFPKLQEVIDRIKRKGIETSLDYQRYETLFIHPEGKRVYLGFSISPLPGPHGSLMGHTLIFQDITKFKEMEEQMIRFDKMAAIGQLAAGMAHEIRNPLTSLSGAIQVLRSELVLDPSNTRLMDIILRESERLNSLITDFLLFAQPPKTNKTLSKIEPLLEETIDLLQNSPKYHSKVRIHRPRGHPSLEVMIDPDQMKQVFWNLLINAAQAMSSGGDLRIFLEKRENGLQSSNPPWPSSQREESWVKISISDSGVGIPPQEKEKIFDPFYTTKDGGTGLGLSIVHKIIENHKGVITVESEVDRGSTFAIFLPTDRDEETKAC